MEVLEVARWQFGITTIYHFFFVPLTIGLSVLTAILQSFYYRTNNQDYKRLTKFFGKLFIIIFAVGVVTGIVLEFQFGMAWSEYSRFVGDIFGIPLAIEALMAFFLESTFIAVWLFGWDRIPKSLHLLSIWLVAIGSTLSSIWILVANAWMQTPVGYVLNEGRAELSDFVAVILNEQMLVMAQHTIIAAFVTGGLFMLGISAWHILRGNQVEIFAKSARIALIFTAVSSILAATTGHSHAQHTVKNQPMKLAAMEGLWETEQPASFSLFATIDQDAKTSKREIKLPYLTSVLAYNNITSEVKGMKDLQAQYEKRHGEGDYLPPVAVVYWSFRIMVGLGMIFILTALYGIVQWWRDRLEQSKKYLKLTTYIMFLPLLANSLGWIVAEMGRQPWIVQDVMLTGEGVSPNVSSGSMLLTTIAFTLVYGVLAAVGIFLLHKYAKPGVAEDDSDAHAY
ncbi:MAG: cytochrome ubiquinol oxidase subunit I [Bacteroidota bacterium]